MYRDTWSEFPNSSKLVRDTCARADFLSPCCGRELLREARAGKETLTVGEKGGQSREGNGVCGGRRAGSNLLVVLAVKLFDHAP